MVGPALFFPVARGRRYLASEYPDAMYDIDTSPAVLDCPEPAASADPKLSPNAGHEPTIGPPRKRGARRSPPASLATCRLFHAEHPARLLSLAKQLRVSQDVLAELARDLSSTTS
jgi:hypothetical protein